MNSKPAAPSQSAHAGRAKRIACAMGTIALGLLSQQAAAGLIASNAGVPATMDAGGTEGNPAVYRFENGFSKNYDWITVGSARSHNEFHVTGGSSALPTNGLYYVPISAKAIREVWVAMLCASPERGQGL